MVLRNSILQRKEINYESSLHSPHFLVAFGIILPTKHGSVEPFHGFGLSQHREKKKPNFRSGAPTVAGFSLE
jgi:hypothetical protein